MKYLSLVILLLVYHPIKFSIAEPFEVSSNSPTSADRIVDFGLNILKNPPKQPFDNLESIESSKTKSHRISDVSVGSSNTVSMEEHKNPPMDHSINQNRQEMYQDSFLTMEIRSQERDKEVSEGFSNSQEITLFGKTIKVNPINTIHKNTRFCEISAESSNTLDKEQYNHSPMDQYNNKKRKNIYQDEPNTIDPTSQEGPKEGPECQSNIPEMTLLGKKMKTDSSYTIDIRNFATCKMNRLCMFYSRYLVEELTSAMTRRFKTQKGLNYQPDLFKQYDTSLFAPFVYFMLLRDPTKAVWNSLLTITSFIMVEFHKQESMSEEVEDFQKLSKFMLWHTEMMYHLTNPNLLDHFRKNQEILTQSSITGINRGNCPITVILSIIASKLSFNRISDRPQGLARLSASYLKAYWTKDYEHNYPVSRRSSILQFSNKQEWDRISQSILESCTLRNPLEFYSGLAELELDEPIIGATSMMLPLKLTEDPKEFENDLFEVKEKLNQEDIRQDLSEIKDSTFFHALGFWMKKHERQQMKFSDTFCVTAIFSFLGAKNPGIDLDLFWKDMQRNEIKRKAECARNNIYHHTVRKLKHSKANKHGQEESQSL